MSISNTAINCDEIEHSTSQSSKPSFNVISCRQCGRSHRPKECPAFGKECAKCHKLHHFAIVCRSRHNPTDSQPTNTPITKSQVTHPKNVFKLKDSELYTSDSECNLLIDPVRIDGLTKPCAWLSTLSTTQGNITLKLDIEAEANILSIATYNKLSSKPPIQPTDVKLTAYGRTSLSPIGVCKLKCNVKAHNTM